jgi:hypothetical protein
LLGRELIGRHGFDRRPGQDALAAVLSLVQHHLTEGQNRLHANRMCSCVHYHDVFFFNSDWAISSADLLGVPMRFPWTELLDRSHLDAPQARHRNLRRHLDGIVQILGVDQDKTA